MACFFRGGAAGGGAQQTRGRAYTRCPPLHRRPVSRCTSDLCAQPSSSPNFQSIVGCHGAHLVAPAGCRVPAPALNAGGGPEHPCAQAGSPAGAMVHRTGEGGQPRLLPRCWPRCARAPDSCSGRDSCGPASRLGAEVLRSTASRSAYRCGLNNCGRRATTSGGGGQAAARSQPSRTPASAVACHCF